MTVEVSLTGEGDSDTRRILVTGEGGETDVPLTNDGNLTEEHTGSDVDSGDGAPASMNVATIRKVRKQSRRAVKQRRVQRALEKQKPATPDDEVERVVAELAEEQRLRREKQAADARRELAERWRKGDDTKNTERPRVSLVREMKVRTALDGDTRLIEEAEASDGLPTALMMVDGHQRAVKIDSGARYSVAGTDWMMRGERVKGTAPVTHVEGIGGFLLDVLGLWKFEMTNVFGQAVTITACIIEGCTSEFLVGIDFLEKHRATMNFECREVRYDERGREVVIPFSTNDDEGPAAAVRLASATNLARRAVQPIEVAVAAPEGEEGVFVPTNDTGTVLMAAAVTKVRNGKALIPAINAHGGRVKLPSKKELGVWIPLGSDMEALAMNGELKTDRVREWLGKIGDTETPLNDESDVQIGVEDEDARELVIRLLRCYRTLTEAPKDCPPATTLDVEHHIDTGDASPILMKRRRQAQTEDETINDNVDTMLKAGVIEESNGAWGFPVVLVKKKDGSVRFCVDYRALNSITKRDVYPLPRIDETLEALGGARLFTTLDLQAGYWQIMVARGDRDKTAFLTKRGLYRFRRMPFGLTNAPATFQRLMNGVLRGLTWTTCLVYLDDIVVFTKGDVEQHVVEVASVLERLACAGLSLKLKKCMFVTGSMEYLGHTLSAQGVQPTERLVKAVAEFPRPRDPTEVKRFVHLAGYYRKFIAGFGSIAAPLTRLLKKDCPWEWTEDQEFAYERVKNLLTTRPLLQYPDFGRSFRMVTDASKVGLGACLMQDFGHGWQPIAFASKVNSCAEANYSITELECLAVVWAVKLFRPYLYGRTFTIVTDHSALKWLMTRPNLAGRLHRWSLTLQEYDFSIEYRPGSTNVVADALSRAPTPDALSSAPAAVRAVIRSRSDHPTLNVAAGNDEAVEQEADTEAMTDVTAARRNTAESTSMDSTGGLVLIPAAGVAQTDGAVARMTNKSDDNPDTVMECTGEVVRTDTGTPTNTTVTPADDASSLSITTDSVTPRMNDTTIVAGDLSSTDTTKTRTANTESDNTAADIMRESNAVTTAAADDTLADTATPSTTAADSGDTVATTRMTNSATTATSATVKETRRKKTRTAAMPAMRRSTRIREKAQRRVHFADKPTPVTTTKTTDAETENMADGDTVYGMSRASSSSNEQRTRNEVMTSEADTEMGTNAVTTVPALTELTAPATDMTSPRTMSDTVTVRSRIDAVTTAPDSASGAVYQPQRPRTPEDSSDEMAGLEVTAVRDRAATSDNRRSSKKTAVSAWPRNNDKAVPRTARPRSTEDPATTTQREKTATTESRRTITTTVMPETTMAVPRVPAQTAERDTTMPLPRTITETTATETVMSGNERRVATSDGRLRATPGDPNGDDDTGPETSTLQLTDAEIMEAQKASKFVKKTLTAGKHRGMKVETRFGLAVIETNNGWRVLLPPTIWAVVFKEMHGSIWAGPLRGPHTYGRVAQLYWWPKLRRAVNQWIRGCPECGSRKARPREVIPPLRSIRGGDVGDRWALDVAGPFPAADGGERFVIAAVEYVTRYAVARCVQQHTAKDIATFLMEEVVLKFGSFRELLTDGAPELTSSIIDVLMTMLQARQTNAVAYRPQMIGLVERFHRTWKDCVAVFMQDEGQKDWNLWVRFATYAYNSARHSTVLLTPNELMMGRRLRAPNELLRRTAVTEAGDLTTYHEQLLTAMNRAQQCAERARIREQERQARYYNRNVRQRREFKVGDRVWLYNPPRGPKATKFVHQWMGPMRIVEPVGYDNFRLKREDQTGATEEMIAHVSFLTSYYEPGSPLSEIATDIDEQLLNEDTEHHDETAATPVRAAAAVNERATTAGSSKRSRTTVVSTANDYYTSGQLVEQRRRRRRNKAGHYLLEYQLFPVGDPSRWTTNDGAQWTTTEGRPRARWVSMAEYERYFGAERVVEDPWVEEDV